MPTWDELFQQEEFRWQEPYPRVVDFARLLKARSSRRVLDLGCGTGRHLIYLAQEGCEAFGIDISPTGLEHARRWLQEEKLSAGLVQADMAAIPYADGFFDGAISIHVIYHGTLQHMRAAICEILRVLKPSGLALLTFQSRRGYRYGRGTELEPHTFIPDTGIDASVPHHFSDREELEDLLQSFAILNIRLAEEVSPRGHLSSHWEVLAAKPMS